MSNDPLVIFTPSGKRGRVAPGTSVLQAARQLGVDLESVCGGRGICSKCQVTPSFGEFPKHGVTALPDGLSQVNAVEERYDRIRGLAPGRRLGCQAQVLRDMVIDIPASSQLHQQVVRKEASVRDMEIDPVITCRKVTVTPPDMHVSNGDFERLRAALELTDLKIPLSVLSRLQKTLRKADWQVYAVLHEDGPTLLDLRVQAPELLGLAIDLGSTTIAAHLCDLQTGEVIASAGVMNPQIRFGEDLMSRVSYAMMNDQGAAEMTKAVRRAIDQLTEDICAQAGKDGGDIFDITLVCNPVMHHLLLGIDPVELGQAPFALARSEAIALAARDLELSKVNGQAQVYILPCIAGHVGADAAAVALSEAPETTTERLLIVDVGTNAELLLATPDALIACSSPTGPAFEGAQIDSGQRAAPGAIERVRIDPVTREAKVQVIGQDIWSGEPGFIPEVTGICGSGIIEAVAEMRMAGIIDATGLIGSAEQIGSDRLMAQGRTHSYILYDGRETGGSLICVTQADIRAIQLAKSALYAGARLLMDEAGIDKLDRIILAGAFGAHISVLHAMMLGMIPDAPLEKVKSAGNSAGTGARMALLSGKARRHVETLVGKITKVETALAPRFQEHFVNANSIPHATDKFEHLPPLPQVSYGKGAQAGRAGRRRTRQVK